MSRQPSRVSPDLVTTKGDARPVETEHQTTILMQQFGRADGPPLRTGKVALNFRLDPELHQRLKIASHRSDVSIQSIVETAVRRYLDSVVP